MCDLAGAMLVHMNGDRQQSLGRNQVQKALSTLTSHFPKLLLLPFVVTCLLCMVPTVLIKSAVC
jgi:hypothetical protein